MAYLRISDTTYIKLANIFSIAANKDRGEVNIRMLDNSVVSIPTSDISYVKTAIESMGGPSFAEIMEGTLFVDPDRITKIEQLTSSLTIMHSTSRANVQLVMSAVDIMKRLGIIAPKAL